MCLQTARKRRLRLFPSLAATLLAASAQAADWSDTALSWRVGNQFAEPFINQDIRKNILGLTHASGYVYGSNFFNADFLLSDKHDPDNFGSSKGAKEIYVVYRHTLNLGKLSGNDIRFGPVRGVGLTGGFDLNRKGDAGYNSRKRMLVLGPTLMMDVPGFLDVSVLWLKESNHPSVSGGAFDPGYPHSRYTYKTHPMLTAAWGIPVGPFTFGGYANLIASKGRDELGNPTVREINVDMKLMYDLGARLGAKANAFQVGLEYQYWDNKFGNSDATVGGLGGNTANTPMIRTEYHF
jgi:nucleoside-specific outer membrane channel protein Tsx